MSFTNNNSLTRPHGKRTTGVRLLVLYRSRDISRPPASSSTQLTTGWAPHLTCAIASVSRQKRDRCFGGLSAPVARCLGSLPVATTHACAIAWHSWLLGTREEPHVQPPSNPALSGTGKPKTHAHLCRPTESGTAQVPTTHPVK